jgi:hypothetical protein
MLLIIKQMAPINHITIMYGVAISLHDLKHIKGILNTETYDDDNDDDMFDLSNHLLINDFTAVPIPHDIDMRNFAYYKANDDDDNCFVLGVEMCFVPLDCSKNKTLFHNSEETAKDIFNIRCINNKLPKSFLTNAGCYSIPSDCHCCT